MIAYLKLSNELLGKFEEVTLEQVPRTQNSRADVLVNVGRHTFIDRNLYHSGFSLPYLRYMQQGKVDYVLREIYEGICGNHFGNRALAYITLW